MDLDNFVKHGLDEWPTVLLWQKGGRPKFSLMCLIFPYFIFPFKAPGTSSIFLNTRRQILFSSNFKKVFWCFILVAKQISKGFCAEQAGCLQGAIPNWFSQWLFGASCRRCCCCCCCFARFRGCCRWLLFGCHSHCQGRFHTGSVVRWQSGSVVITGCSIGDYSTKAAFDLWGHVGCCWCFYPLQQERNVLNMELRGLKLKVGSTSNICLTFAMLGCVGSLRKDTGRTWIESSNGSFRLSQRQRFWRSLKRGRKGPCRCNLNNRNVHRKSQLTFYE